MVLATLAWVFGIVGLLSLALALALAMAMALQVLPLLAPALTGTLLMTAATNLLLLTIACAIPACRPRAE